MKNSRHVEKIKFSEIRDYQFAMEEKADENYEGNN